MYRAMQDTVDEVGRVAAAEGIDCHWAKGGTVQLARSAAQLERARDEVAEAREFGFGEEDLRLLTAAEAASGLRAPTCSARRTRRTARPSTPPGWCAGLAEAVRRRGVAVHEQTPVTEIAPGRLRTPRARCGPVRDPGHRGVHAAAARPASGPSRRCTR